MSGHPPDLVEWAGEELLVDEPHQAKVLLRLSDRFMIEERGAIDSRRHCALIDNDGYPRSVIPRLTCRSMV